MKNFSCLLALATTLSINTAMANHLAAPVTVVEVNERYLLADRNQLTAYTFDRDQPNTSVCTGGCARQWPPLLVLATDVVAEPFAVITRADGSTQLTYNGKPLYLYVGDSAPGSISGDGIGGVWHAVEVDEEEAH